MRIFISHSSVNVEVADKICQILEKTGHTCFFAPRDIRSGYEYSAEIINGLDNSDVLLLLMSSDANKSPHVLREVERAVSKGIGLLVYKLEDVELSNSMEYFLMTTQWITSEKEGDYGKILECVEQKSKTVSSDATTVTLHKKNGITKKWLIVVAGVVVFVIAGIAVLFNGENVYNNDMEQAYEKDVETNTDEILVSSELVKDVKPGATFELGTYNGERIKWRVIKFENDKRQAVVIAHNILTMKAFDAAEGGKYNSYEGNDYWATRPEELVTLDKDKQINIRGNNQWSVSNIRTWLNSDNENVIYEDTAPEPRAMSEMTNGYNAEAGFLHDFSDSEKDAILVSDIKTGDIISKDKVFLLSEEELIWLSESNVSKYAVPTEAAVQKDSSNWYNVHLLNYGVEDYKWWLRDGDGSSYCECYTVCDSYAGGMLEKRSVGLEGFGIRPAMKVDLTSDAIRWEKE